MPPSAPRSHVQSVGRSLDLLEALAGVEQLGVTELAARTGLVPSTVHRLLATLVERGYASQAAASGRYRLGPKVLELASAVETRTARLRAAARPSLEAVQRATGETANLVVLEGLRAVYVDQVEGSRTVRMFTEVGRSIEAHTTGSGKAILAHRPAEELDRLYPRGGAELARLTARTITTAGALREDLARIRRRGYAIDSEEHEEGVSCIACAVLDAGGVAQAAISISGPTARILHADTGELGELLRHEAARVADLFRITE